MQTIINFLKLIRLPNLLIIAFTQYMVRWCLIYPILKVREYELQMNNLSFFLLSLSTVMIAAAGYIINDYFDAKIDRVNKPERLLIDKSIKRRIAMGAHVVINLIGIGIGTALCYLAGFWKMSAIYFICAAGLWYYSTIFKRKFLIGNLIIALFIAFVPLIAGAFEIWLDYIRYSTIENPVSFSDIKNWVIGISAFAFITTLLREMIKDIEDHDGDKEYGCTTLPIVLGINKAKVIITALIIVTMIFLSYLQYLQFTANDKASFYYFLALQVSFVFLIYKLVIAKNKKDYHFASVFSKVIMLIGICYLFLFSYILLAL
jgi:4-hydroxybenzoate polyprenyltransferase